MDMLMTVYSRSSSSLEERKVIF